MHVKRLRSRGDVPGCPDVPLPKHTRALLPGAAAGDGRVPGPS